MNREAATTPLKKLLREDWRAYCQLIKSTAKNPTAKKVHELRIQILKLQVAMELAACLKKSSSQPLASKLKKQLKKTKKRMSPLRDVHVELAKLKNISSSKKLRSFEKHLKKREQKNVGKVRRHLRELSLDQQESLIKGIYKDLGGNVNPNTSVQISHYIKNTLLQFKKQKQASRKGGAKILHGLRAEAKHLRYLGEAQRSILGTTIVDLPLMKKTQTILGKVQDDCVLLKNIDRFTSKHHQKNMAVKNLRLKVTTQQKKHLEKWEN